MVRRNYNRKLNNSTKLQSSLGRVAPVYKEYADTLTMAKVLKVNYIYNTVDVVTIKYSERVAKDSSTSGKFSAKIPVMFGGQMSNGDTYGQTIPIDVGDQVLLGFIDKDKNSPIILNIYKNSDTASELAPTDSISGNPEDSELARDALEQFNLYPSQTYRLIDGLGGVENTYQGKSFFKSTLTGTGNGKLNDYGFSYEQLSRYKLRGRNIYPYYLQAPQMLFQHTGDDLDLVNNVFLDSTGEMRLSTYSKSSEDRVDLAFDSADTVLLSYQKGDNQYNKGEHDSEVGISEGKPTMKYGEHVLTFDDNGILVDGKPVSGSGGTSDEKIKEVEEELDELKSRIDELNPDEIAEKLNYLSDKVDNVLIPEYVDLSTAINGFDNRITSAEGVAQNAQRVSEDVARTISDAAGTDESLIARLDRVDNVIKGFQDIVTEVVAARTYNKTSSTYKSLGVRIDTIEEMVRTDRDRLNELINKLDIFLSDDFSKGVASYVATIQAYGDLVMRNGQGEVTLQARLYKAGFEWTSLLTDDAFVWTRNSDDSEGDATWNANHVQGKKAITLTSADFGYNATFSVNVTVQGNLVGG